MSASLHTLKNKQKHACCPAGGPHSLNANSYHLFPLESKPHRSFLHSCAVPELKACHIAVLMNWQPSHLTHAVYHCIPEPLARMHPVSFLALHWPGQRSSFDSVISIVGPNACLTGMPSWYASGLACASLALAACFPLRTGERILPLRLSSLSPQSCNSSETINPRDYRSCNSSETVYRCGIGVLGKCPACRLPPDVQKVQITYDIAHQQPSDPTAHFGFSILLLLLAIYFSITITIL